ncbi:protein Shroom4-like isoform X2 [Hyla sarda]|uniref:protein Shroom4-like isoform X2 n=1 Tax=Hyla sarda TaxID=327740 RepID=UPI0024C36EA5|nr:protein Shroom4-like isoform X2 [Hyla sarda]
MDSFGQPGQNHYEGMISPLEPGMHQNKSDSAYSSFSTSSNVSNYTVSARMDVVSPINCFLSSNKQEKSQYLQTGQGAIESQVNISKQSLNEHFQNTSIFPYAMHHLDNINSPPQPPIHRDSLRENKNQLCNCERRASASGDSFHIPRICSSENGEFSSSENAFCQCTNDTCTVRFPENLSSDQYYMLSSQTDKIHQINTCAKDEERQPNQCNELKWSEDDRKTNLFNYNSIGEVLCNSDHMATETDKNSGNGHWKRLDHPSTQTKMSKSSEDCRFSSDKCKEICRCSTKKHFEISHELSTEQLSNMNGVDLCSSLDKSFRMSNEGQNALSSLLHNYVDETNLSCNTNTLTRNASEKVESVAPFKKSGLPRHRSAQMRRKSDRFATNLRNEIQRQKAQLQKSKDSRMLLSAEDSIDDKYKAFESPVELIPSPPPPPPKNMALLLEIKRANTEMCRSSKDYFNQVKYECEFNDKNDIYKHSIKENMSIKEAFIDDKELFVPSQNKTYNEGRTSESSAMRQQESLFQKRNRVDHRKKTEQKGMAPKSEQFFDESASVSTSMPSSPDKREIEDEICKDSLKITVEYIDSSGLERKPPCDVSSVDILGNSCNKTPTETLDKHIHGNDTCIMNNQSFDYEKKWNFRQCISNKSVTEEKTINQASLRTNNKVHDENKSDDFPSAVHLKSPHHFSEFKNNISQHNPNNDAKCIGREVGQKLNGMQMEETVPIISKTNDENILMPFADRRKFFEDVSKEPTSYLSVNDKPKKNICPSIPDNIFSQTMASDLKRHYLPPARRQDSGLPHGFCINHTVDPLKCCNQEKLSNYLPSLTYGYRAACVFCSDLCPSLLKRYIPPPCQGQHLHRHHLHRWTQCTDYLCPTQYDSLEEGGSLHIEPRELRKPLPQDISLMDWNKHMKIHRKCSQSVSDLCHFPSGTQHPSSLKPCCEENNQDWPQCFKTTSLYNISGENIPRLEDFALFEDGHPGPSLLQNRAYAVNHLNMEYLALRERIKSPTTKLEEKEPYIKSKKQGPPRPPPPKWEKYGGHRVSKRDSKSGFFHCEEDVRQCSQSLPVDRASFSEASNLPPSPNHGFNHNKEICEIRCASQGSQESATSLFQNTSTYDEFQPISSTPLCETISPSTCATYQNASSAKISINRMKEMAEVQEKDGYVTEGEDEENELTVKKVQLIKSISRKLSVLREAQLGLQEDINANATLGCELKTLLQRVCKPNEYDKFRIFVGDLDKVVSLLLSLSGRLSRVESALNCEDPEPSMEEKLNLMEKKKQLIDQLEDAKELKAHVTRREKIVLETLEKYLSDEQLQDYHHYVKMTSALIVEQRELEDKIRLGEEQLRCLRESL